MDHREQHQHNDPHQVGSFNKRPRRDQSSSRRLENKRQKTTSVGLTRNEANRNRNDVALRCAGFQPEGVRRATLQFGSGDALIVARVCIDPAFRDTVDDAYPTFEGAPMSVRFRSATTSTDDVGAVEVSGFDAADGIDYGDTCITLEARDEPSRRFVAFLKEALCSRAAQLLLHHRRFSSSTTTADVDAKTFREEPFVFLPGQAEYHARCVHKVDETVRTTGLTTVVPFGKKVPVVDHRGAHVYNITPMPAKDAQEALRRVASGNGNEEEKEPSDGDVVAIPTLEWREVRATGFNRPPDYVLRLVCTRLRLAPANARSDDCTGSNDQRDEKKEIKSKV